MNLEQAQAWVKRPLTEAEVRQVAYLSKGQVDGSHHVLVCTAFAVGDVALLSEQVPSAVLTQVYGAGRVAEADLSQLTLNHVEVEVDGVPSTIFALSANYELPNLPVSRKRPTNAEDVEQWLGLTEGYSVQILTVAERAALLPEGNGA